MRIVSTPPSVGHGEPTVLAIVETIVAMAFTVFIAIQFGTLKWIAVSACVAPLLLLRTEKSVELGVAYFNKFLLLWNHDRFPGLFNFFAFSFFLIICVPIAAVFCRIVATIIAVALHPIQSVMAIPTNWSRVALCLDLARPPEAVPGWDAQHEMFVFLPIFQRALAFTRQGILQFLFVLLFGFPFLVLLYVPAILFRWSLKSTSIIYLPLIWIVSAADTGDTRTQLQRIQKSDIARIARTFSALTVILFTMKIIFMTGWNELDELLDSSWLGRPFADVVRPQVIPIWQLAATLNAILSIGMYYFAGEMLFREEHKDRPWAEPQVDRMLRTSRVVGRVVSVYTISCTLFLAFTSSLVGHLVDLNVPRVDVRLFPWL